MGRSVNVLDLFSGIGGFSLGLERAGMRTVAFCEIDPYCRQVLARHWPGVPVYRDIRDLRGDELGPIDVVCGGFPCQPFSSAGKRRGKDDDRYLWPEMLRVIREAKPRWVIGENVTHIDRVALEDVLSGLEGCGYETAPPLEIPACALGADHWRARIWILGHADRDREPGVPLNAEVARHSALQAHAHGWQREVGRHLAGGWRQRELDASDPDGGHEDHAERVGANDGLPNRMDRLRALGNSIHPGIAEVIGRAIMHAEVFA
jgi:DNA (cytosine-5)-methyltransferase 1